MTIGAWIDQAILKAKNGELPAIGTAEESAQTTTSPAPTPLVEPAPAPDPLTVNPQDRFVASETRTADIVEPATETAADTAIAAPAQSENSESSIDAALPAEEVAVRQESIAADTVIAEPATEPRPLAPPPQRSSSLRYAVLGIVFAGILGAGGWLYLQMPAQDQTPASRNVADASPTPAPAALPTPTPTPAPIAEAPPPPPAASSVTPPAETTAPSSAPPAVAAPAAPPRIDGLPADLPAAVRNVIDRAQAGDAKSQFNLGMLYLAGRVGDKNPTEAAKWFERAAEQGVATAQFNLGVLYQRGEGVTQNDERAVSWYRKAATQNFAQAQHNLATAYAEGKGTDRSYPKAAEWFAKSAEAGLSQSQYSLGALHESGLISGQPDKAEARRWYERALAKGDKRASARLAALNAPAQPAQTSPATPAAPPAGAIGRAEIRQIQTLLSRMNFNPGPADGQMGKRTADAIRLYQKFAGMDEDGAPSQELLEDLQAVAETMSKGS